MSRRLSAIKLIRQQRNLSDRTCNDCVVAVLVGDHQCYRTTHSRDDAESDLDDVQLICAEVALKHPPGAAAVREKVQHDRRSSCPQQAAHDGCRHSPHKRPAPAYRLLLAGLSDNTVRMWSIFALHVCRAVQKTLNRAELVVFRVGAVPAQLDGKSCRDEYHGD